MKYNSRDEYVGGNFFLLDLVEAEYSTLREYVAKIEEEERLQLIAPDDEDESGQESGKGASEEKSSNGPVNYSRQG